MTEHLFENFDPVSTTAWLEKIRFDLKISEEAFVKTMEETEWISEEGIRIKPFYNQDDIKDSVAAPQEDKSKWDIIELVEVKSPQQANSDALSKLTAGAESITFDLEGKELTQEVYDQLIDGILLELAPISFMNYGKRSSHSQDNPNGCHLDDRLLHALRHDNFEKAHFWTHWKEALNLELNTSGQSFAVNGTAFKDAGANHVQELAFCLSLGNEYLHQLDDAQMEGLTTIRVRLGLAGNFFFEVAKLQAIRKLWRVLISKYTDRNIELYLESTSSTINKNEKDVHGNMLRNTTECMSAVLGSSDGINIRSDHREAHANTVREQRWATNISHILKNESHFGRNDPARGSYYVESLTMQLAEKAWEKFKDIESRGGFIDCWLSGEIEQAIQKSFDTSISNLSEGKSILVGVTGYLAPEGHKESFPEMKESSLRLPARNLPHAIDQLGKSSS